MQGIDIAKNYLGLQEVKDRSKLIAFFNSENMHCDPSTTAWCACFVNSCERAARKPGNGDLNAKSFLTYGDPIDEDNAVEGDIIVFNRANNPALGHVGYFVSWDDDNARVMVLGGNQSSPGQVCYEWHAQSMIAGLRRHV